MARTIGNLVVFILKRLAQLIPVLLGVVVLAFVMTHSVPDACALWIPKAKPDALAACRNYYGLNLPITDQFYRYVSALLQGNWGNSPPPTNAPVLPQIASAVPATLQLVLASLFIMIVVGIPLGVIAATSNGKWADHLVRVFYLSGWATPTYLGGVLLAVFVGPVLGLPTKHEYGGTIPFTQYTHMPVLDALLSGNPGYLWNAVAHLILPATALAFLNMGIATRMTRTSMLEILPMEYVKTARMKGLSEFTVVYKHALRNALITTVTVLGITGGTLLSGTIVIEDIFSYEGVGDFAFSAISNYDVAGTIAVVIVFAVAVVISNLIADILYGVLDPRVDWR